MLPGAKVKEAQNLRNQWLLLGSKMFTIYFHDHEGTHLVKVKERKVKWMLAQDNCHYHDKVNM